MQSESFTQSLPGADHNPVVVGGLTPLTTIDYPGQLSSVLFLQGCPWRCGYCHNAELLKPDPEKMLPWHDVLSFLIKRRGLLDAVVFSGGEPTLQAGLATAMQQVRDLGFSVGLHTAGIYPHRLARILPLVDWVGLDFKSATRDYERLTGVPRSAERAWLSLQLIRSSGVDYEVRTTVHPDLLSTEQLDDLFLELAEAGAKHVVVQECVTTHCRLPDLRTMEKPLPPTGFFSRYQDWFERFDIRLSR